MSEDTIMRCEHKNTKTWTWMSRQETVCTDCWKDIWHEDKPMAWTDMETGEVVVRFGE